ncbi:MAG: DEAD/DEAH box helicase, partial [Deinococcus sp.]
MSAGEHVIVTTPTASGKTGAFFPAVFQRLEEDSNATALFVYPLVALGQDQRDKLQAFREAGGFPWQIGAFQGGASAAEVFRDGVRMVTATPDKLHWALTQPGVQAFLKNLAFLVLDEAHSYRGGFGSEVAGMLRRLLELARALGANPQVVLSTATIGNPAQFARELSGLEVREVGVSGAPGHGKRYYLADH